ncbi:IniB N-terminal domain-containing protein [Lentzea sp. NPDC051213]|uniref:IniB N-terminal domain-containing protein n=1 Tax=Lentzea sp. NPDC051213 TaxID=3364126 RepID=UPI0037AD71C2
MLSNLIDFLMNLLKDDEAKKAFDENPDGELNKAGLNGVTGQDVRDARLIMADSGGVRARGAERSSSNDDDPVREIHHTTREYVVEKPVTNIEQNISIDDRDVTIIDDSFNSDDDTEVNSVAIQDNDTNVVQVKDSFNEPEPKPAEEPDVLLEPEPLEDDPEIVLDDPVVLPEPEPEAFPVDVEPEPVAEPDPVIA